MTALLEVDDLHVRYGRIPVVHGISFTVPEGRVVGLLGANGAGKSTTMRAIMGQRSATGRVRFDGTPIDSLAPHKIVARGIALVPEGRLVFKTLTVEKNLRMGAYALGRTAFWQAEAGIDEVLTLFPELKPLLRREAGELSGGLQQMLALGRALMARPRLLVLDEPSLGLAPLVIERIYEAVLLLKSRGTSILLAEQNARLALRSVDYAYVLQTGQIVEQGDSEFLRSSSRVEEIYLGGDVESSTPSPTAS
ncbi:amino acid/amide ABC transporter ATP-binding protein 2, HAAT family [Micromonospora pallida]|uniref:Amino acid/amide ABC transporter ATP-binding protein 2, HAAT family n=1 Tax=Micromonospora pallida TaxID=145854 RepID=A0A1C6RS82_9ACTN|nr:ABC transporter ATP-binding protein [Micromonospora pallida]SCL20066.1 amino acid/amide ABC transporter ATP-binding protein 2, HAAT family [Micromonospora pallida]